MRMNTPERAPPVKRRADEDGMPVDEESLKARRLADDSGMSMSSTQMEKDMSEEDRKILASMLLGVDITEVYLPERIARVAMEFGLVAVSSMDLTNGWDFTRSDHRRAAWIQIEKEDPYLLVGSPPCTWFSVLQELNLHVNRNNPAWRVKYEAEKVKTIQHVIFCFSLYDRQLKRGKHFLHEHPWSARSWKLPKIGKLLEHPAVTLTQGHMCQFGMETFDDKKLGTKGPVKKPTGFMTSSQSIARELDRQCPGDHQHVPLMGGRAAGAAIYPRKLCEAVSRGILKQKAFDNIISTGNMSRSRAISFLQAVRRGL